jgi:NO-binding membrane sensor protein with MHYT domain
LDDYRAQRRAGRIAWNILVAAVVAIGMITTSVALHREQRLQMMESGR